MDRGGRIVAKVHTPRYRRSPIPKGGLEIIVKITFTIDDEKKRYLERLRELIIGNYETPEEEVEMDESQGQEGPEIFEVVDESDEEEQEDTLGLRFIDDEEGDEGDEENFTPSIIPDLDLSDM